jgi:hypothetical protein
MTRQSIILATLIFLVIAAGMHFTCCEWRTLGAYRSNDALSYDESDSDAEVAANFLGWTLARGLEQAADKRRSIWLHRNDYGRGFGLYVRANVDYGAGCWFGAVLPSILIFGAAVGAARCTTWKGVLSDG